MTKGRDGRDKFQVWFHDYDVDQGFAPFAIRTLDKTCSLERQPSTCFLTLSLPKFLPSQGLIWVKELTVHNLASPPPWWPSLRPPSIRPSPQGGSPTCPQSTWEPCRSPWSRERESRVGPYLLEHHPRRDRDQTKHEYPKSFLGFFSKFGIFKDNNYQQVYVYINLSPPLYPTLYQP